METKIANQQFPFDDAGYNLEKCLQYNTNDLGGKYAQILTKSNFVLINRILDGVSKEVTLSLDVILMQSHVAEYVRARQLIILLMKEQLKFTDKVISLFIGLTRDATTSSKLDAYQRISNDRWADEEFTKKFKKVTLLLVQLADTDASNIPIEFPLSNKPREENVALLWSFMKYYPNLKDILEQDREAKINAYLDNVYI